MREWFGRFGWLISSWYQQHPVPRETTAASSQSGVRNARLAQYDATSVASRASSSLIFILIVPFSNGLVVVVVAVAVVLELEQLIGARARPPNGVRSRFVGQQARVAQLLNRSSASSALTAFTRSQGFPALLAIESKLDKTPVLSRPGI